jgi:hypothetical protein
VHQVGFSLHDYIKMHGQQKVLKKKAVYHLKPMAEIRLNLVKAQILVIKPTYINIYNSIHGDVQQHKLVKSDFRP